MESDDEDYHSEDSFSEGEEDEELLSDEEDSDGNNPPNVDTGNGSLLWSRFVPPVNPSVPEMPEYGTPSRHARVTVRQGEALSCFRLFFDRLMVDKICEYSTMESQRCPTAVLRNWTLTPKDFDQFLSVIIGRAAFDAKQMNMTQLRSADWGPQFFRNGINSRRLATTLGYLRFDDKKTRAARLKEDRLAMVSEIWHRFTRNCRVNYKVGSHLNLDFQMVHSSVSCKFSQQIQEMGKKNKNGLLFMLLVDPSSNYVVHGVPYLHERRPQAASDITERLALNLLRVFDETGKTVITGDRITSVSLARNLLKKNITLVGAQRVMKTGEGMYRNVENVSIYDTLAYKCQQFTLTIHSADKNKKPAVVLSSKHMTVSLDDSHTKTPDTYEFFRKNGQAVATIDYAIRQLSTRLRCNRWTMYVFYNLLDLAILNSWILYNSITGSKLNRRQYMFQLAEELAAGEKPSTFDEGDPFVACLTNSTPDQPKKRFRCAVKLNERCKRTKTKIACRFCAKYCCLYCSSGLRNVCQNCFKKNRSVFV